MPIVYRDLSPVCSEMSLDLHLLQKVSMKMSTMQITVAKTYNVAELDTAIKNVADKATSVNSSVKEYAVTLSELKAQFDKNADRFKSIKFPAWLETVFTGKIAGQTCYKYAQIATAFHDESALWDVFTLSKLGILLNTRTKSITDPVEAVWTFLEWYGDTVNQNQTDRWNAWNESMKVVFDKVKECLERGDEETAKLWKERIKPEPKKGVDTTDIDASEYNDICSSRALDHLSSVPDTILSEIVKAYRKPDEYKIDESGKAQKLEVVSESNNSESENDEPKPKTQEELKEDARTALLAYVSALGTKAPKSLQTALTVLNQKEEK